MFSLQHHFEQQLNRHSHGVKRWVIALSGGLDSVVLLDLAARIIPAKHPSVIHVNHQLQPQADGWSSFCQQLADQYQIEFKSIRVTVDAGASVERAARNARYQAFEQYLQSGDCLLLAQHRNDQAETLLYRLLRGAGLKGLAAMPRTREIGMAFLQRPLLSVSRDQLQSWAEKAQLNWIEDPSNADLSYDRNYLRHQVMPLLRARWPGFEQRWSDTADYLRDADQLLTELAQIDLQTVADERNSLSCAGLNVLSIKRRDNLLRVWLAEQGLPAGAKVLMSIGQMIEAVDDSSPELKLASVKLRRYRGRLYLTAEQNDIDWQGRLLPDEGLHLPQGSLLVVKKLNGLRSLAGVTLRNRCDGDRCSPVGRGGSTSLKKLFQENAVPPWQRKSWPVCVLGDEIVAVPGICVCEGWQVEKDVAGFHLKWVPAALSVGSDSGTL